MIGKNFKHAHCTGVSCTVLAVTAKGFKVSQTEIRARKKPKTVIQYYYTADFIGGGALWLPVN